VSELQLKPLGTSVVQGRAGGAAFGAGEAAAEGVCPQPEAEPALRQLGSAGGVGIGTLLDHDGCSVLTGACWVTSLACSSRRGGASG